MAQPKTWTEDEVQAMHRGFYEDDQSYREIGRKFGISHERVRQLFNDFGLPTQKVPRLTRAKQRRENEASERQAEIIETYKRLGSVQATARAVKLPAKHIKRYIDEIPGRNLYYRHGATTNGYTREKVGEILRIAAEIAGEPLTTPAYNNLAPTKGWPAYMTIMRLFPEGWTAACKYAGVEANAAKGPRGSSITKEQCNAALQAYAEAHDGELPTYDRYSDWARDNGYPSGGTVRGKSEGSWTKALKDAFELA